MSLLQTARNLHPSSLLKEDDEKNGEKLEEMFHSSTSTLTMIGFKVKNATFFPPEVGKGIWPEYYSLSDHAHLTVEFSLVEMNHNDEEFLFHSM